MKPMQDDGHCHLNFWRRGDFWSPISVKILHQTTKFNANESTDREIQNMMMSHETI